jgi:hypothetical protein
MNATETKERSTRFVSDEVLATLAGRKWQFRRAVKPQPQRNADGSFTQWRGRVGRSNVEIVRTFRKPDVLLKEEKRLVPISEWLTPECPYGKIGDRLFIKEKWATSVKSGIRQVAFAADGRWYSPSATFENIWHGYVTGVTENALPEWQELKGRWVGRGYFNSWRPSTQMPRSVARLILEVTGVRVERLQEISEADAMAEGVEQSRDTRNANDEAFQFRDYLRPPGSTVQSAVDSFKTHWDAMNGRGAWDENPWVYAVSFKPIG